MNASKTARGFNIIEHLTYANEPKLERLVQESSAVGDYDDSLDNPGSSFLWLCQDFHLNREEVRELIDIMKYWLDNKKLPEDCHGS